MQAHGAILHPDKFVKILAVQPRRVAGVEFGTTKHKGVKRAECVAGGKTDVIHGIKLPCYGVDCTMDCIWHDMDDWLQI
jgi:hypothetical protein